MEGKGTECKHHYRISSGKKYIKNGNREISFYNENGILRDVQRKFLYSINEKFLTIRKKVDIKKMDGSLAATIKKAGLPSLSLSDWEIKVPDGPDIVVNKGLIGQTLTIKSGGYHIAKVRDISVSWESYTVEIEPRQNDALILIIISVITAEYYCKYLDLMSYDPW